MDNRTKTALTSGAFTTQRSQFVGVVNDDNIIVKYSGENIIQTNADSNETTVIEHLTPESNEIVSAYDNFNIKGLHIPPQIKELAAGSLAGMEKIEEIDIPDVEEFNEECLAGMAANAEPVIVNLRKAKRIADGAFAGANADIYLNDDVEDVGEYAFTEAKHLFYNGNLEKAPFGALAWN